MSRDISARIVDYTYFVLLYNESHNDVAYLGKILHFQAGICDFKEVVFTHVN